MMKSTLPFAGALVALVFTLFASPLLQAEEAPKEPAPKEAAWKPVKRIWARDMLWTDAPKLEVAEWLTEKPELEGKFILVEFWRTWCGACRAMSPRMNELHRKFGDDLVVIAITGESVDKVKKVLPGWKKEYYVAIDKPRAQDGTETKNAANTSGDEPSDDEGVDSGGEGTVYRSDEQGTFEAHFGVWGWPHAVLLEPKHRAVVWQGFPGMKGHELTVEKVGKYLERGRTIEKEGAEKSPSGKYHNDD